MHSSCQWIRIMFIRWNWVLRIDDLSPTISEPSCLHVCATDSLRQQLQDSQAQLLLVQAHFIRYSIQLLLDKCCQWKVRILLFHGSVQLSGEYRHRRGRSEMSGSSEIIRHGATPIIIANDDGCGGNGSVGGAVVAGKREQAVTTRKWLRNPVDIW